MLNLRSKKKMIRNNMRSLLLIGLVGFAAAYTHEDFASFKAQHSKVSCYFHFCYFREALIFSTEGTKSHFHGLHLTD